MEQNLGLWASGELGLISISPRLGYWPASPDPLCADIGVYEGRDSLWIFDVGCGEQAAERINRLPGKKRVVISHFHQDHMGNLPRISREELYLGRYTLRHAGAGQVVEAPMEPEPGLRLFPIPSSHAKGCLGMEVGGRYAFLGDAAYSTRVDGRIRYNATLLQDTIRTLEALSAPWFLLSHGEPFARPKEEVLEELREIYTRRAQGEAYIDLE